jgi:hypothetical protein
MVPVDNFNPMINNTSSNSMNNNMNQMGNVQGNNPMQPLPMMNTINQTNNNQQTIMMSSNDGPTFNNSLNGISPLNPQINAQNDAQELKMKSKLKIDFKKILVIIVVLLLVIAGVLCLVFSKKVTCSSVDQVQGIDVTTTVTANFWFGKINKIKTIRTVDLSNLDENEKENKIKEYKENVSKEAIVDVSKDKIKITTINKPTKNDDTNVSHEEFKEAYEGISFTCK